MALLVQIHPHHQRLAQRPGDLDEAHPRRVDAQDVADDELAVAGAGGVDDGLRFGDGLGQRLLAEDVAAGLDGGARVGAVGLGVGVHAHDVWTRGVEGVVEVRELGKPAQFLAQRAAAGRTTADQADDLELGHPVIGAGVAGAHVAAAGDEHAKGTCHV